VVTTGQQPGLFGGPGYAWLKALSARALADRIEQATGIPAAPVFWAATDDADFDEAHIELRVGDNPIGADAADQEVSAFAADQQVIAFAADQEGGDAHLQPVGPCPGL
jgi:uncharacterized protein YllA (UPF0747 family)